MVDCTFLLGIGSRMAKIKIHFDRSKKFIEFFPHEATNSYLQIKLKKIVFLLKTKTQKTFISLYKYHNTSLFILENRSAHNNY